MKRLRKEIVAPMFFQVPAPDALRASLRPNGPEAVRASRRHAPTARGGLRMGNRAWLRTFWDLLRTSFWFVPLLMAFGGAALAGLCLQLKGVLQGRAQTPWYIYVSGPEDARNLASTLLSSMITMASLVFSITMVVLTLAAGQFGPRLVRNFMASLQTQVVLGVFVLTIVHCLLSLAAIGWRPSNDPEPYPTVSLAILLTLVSLGMLVYHLHVLGRSIVSETVIARVGGELDAALDTLGELRDEEAEPEAALPPDFDERARSLGVPATGFVQAIDFGGLVAAAERADVLVGLTFRAGDFVIAKGGASASTRRAGRIPT
jgi:uncharacterized membrane protein